MNDEQIDWPADLVTYSERAAYLRGLQAKTSVSSDRASGAEPEAADVDLMPASELVALSSRYAEACDDMALYAPSSGRSNTAKYHEALGRADSVHQKIQAAVTAVYREVERLRAALTTQAPAAFACQKRTAAPADEHATCPAWCGSDQCTTSEAAK